MIFVAMTEHAITFIEAPTHFDAKTFAPSELDAGDDPVVVERAVGAGPGRPDVELKWIGTDASARPDRRLMVGRWNAAGVIEWRSEASDRKRRGAMLATEELPPLHTIKRTITTKTLPPGTLVGAAAWAPPSTSLAWQTLHNNLSAVQDRCNSLLNEARFARRERDAWFETVLRFVGLSESQRKTRLGAVVVDLLRERCRQDAKWGMIWASHAPQDALAIPFGMGGNGSRELADEARAYCDDAFKRGVGTWADVIREEVAEALAEDDPVKLRAELIQLGAVCMKCVEILDWKAGA